MKQQTITAAPQAVISDALYEQWLVSHTGTRDDFILFLATPDIDRMQFLLGLDREVDIAEGIGFITYKAD